MAEDEQKPKLVSAHPQIPLLYEKSRIRETKNLSTDADSRIDTKILVYAKGMLIKHIKQKPVLVSAHPPSKVFQKCTCTET